MRIAAFLGIILSGMMGFIIYLNYSIGNIYNDSSVAIKRDLFNLPKAELRKNLDQLNDLKKIKKSNVKMRQPASSQYDYNVNELDDQFAIERKKIEYNEFMAEILSGQYAELIFNPEGMTFDEVELRRLQVISYKSENGVEPEFIETLPLDYMVAVRMAGENIEELSLEDIKLIRKQFTYDEIISYFILDKNN